MNWKKLLFYILNLLYSSLMIFYAILPKFIIIFISAILFVYDFFTMSKEFNKSIGVFIAGLLFLPVSFVSILATPYETLPITWFYLSFLLLMIIVVLKNQLEKKFFLFYQFFISFFLISIIYSKNIVSSLSQFLTISICLFSFQIGEFLKNNFSNKLMEEIQKCYIITSVSVAFQILLQRFWITNTGQIIGHYSLMGGDRIAYAGLMNDYSFASLYLVTAAMLLLILFVETKKVSIINFVILFSFLVFTSILVSARTGIFSLIVTILLYFIFRFKKDFVKVSILSVIGLTSVPFLLNYLTSIRKYERLFDGSGRLELAYKAWNVFLKNPVIGVGFGRDNLVNNYNMIVPHNFFIQYLLQFGIVGFVIIVFNFFIFYMKYSRNNYLMWLFLLCFIGSMLIPDIVSSRFLSVIIVMIMINSSKNSLIQN